MSNVDKAAEKLVSSIRSGKAAGRTGTGKSAKKKQQASGKPSARKPPAGKRAAAKTRAKASRSSVERQRPDNPDRAGYALGGLRWPD
jgi:hypothetical protein